MGAFHQGLTSFVRGECLISKVSSLAAARGERLRKAGNDEPFAVSELLKLLQTHGPVLYEHSVIMGLRLSRALRAISLTAAERRHFESVGQLYEIAAIGMTLKAWLTIPEPYTTQLSALMLYDFGQEAIGDDVYGLGLPGDMLPIPMQIVQLCKLQLEAERSHRSSAPIQRISYSTSALAAYELAGRI